MFPKDTITLTHELQGVGSFTLVSGNDAKYIVGASVQQSATNSTSELKCGNETLVRNYGKDFPFNYLSYKCNASIVVTKTGNDNATFIVSYVPYDIYLGNEASNSATLNDISYNLVNGFAQSNMIGFTGFVLIGFLVAMIVGFFSLK